MRRILILGHNDIRRFLRERSSIVWLFLMPLVFVYAGHFVARGPGGPNVPKPAVLIDNRDAGFLGRVFLAELGSQQLTLVTPGEPGEANRGIVIPADFTARVLARQQAKLEFYRIEGADEMTALLVEARLLRALIALNAHIVEYVRDKPKEPLTEAGLLGVMARPDLVSLEAKFAGRKPIPVGFNQSLPGTLVMYLLLNLLIYGGASVASERRNGVLRRLAVSPVTRAELLFGRIYGLLLLAGAQIAFFLVLGQFVLRVDVGEQIAGIVVTLLAFSWVAASLGVLIGFLVKAEEKVVGLCLLVVLPTAALGGCWWPLEIVPPTLQKVAHAVPTAWAMDALHQLITFGAGFARAAPAIGVLFLFGLAANLAAARFFRV